MGRKAAFMGEGPDSQSRLSDTITHHGVSLSVIHWPIVKAWWLIPRGELGFRGLALKRSEEVNREYLNHFVLAKFIDGVRAVAELF